MVRNMSTFCCIACRKPAKLDPTSHLCDTCSVTKQLCVQCFQPYLKKDQCTCELVAQECEWCSKVSMCIFFANREEHVCQTCVQTSDAIDANLSVL
jgi:hypothetical protein